MSPPASSKRRPSQRRDEKAKHTASSSASFLHKGQTGSPRGWRGHCDSDKGGKDSENELHGEEVVEGRGFLVKWVE